MSSLRSSFSGRHSGSSRRPGLGRSENGPNRPPGLPEAQTAPNRSFFNFVCVRIWTPTEPAVSGSSDRPVSGCVHFSYLHYFCGETAHCCFWYAVCVYVSIALRVCHILCFSYVLPLNVVRRDELHLTFLVSRGWIRNSYFHFWHDHDALAMMSRDHFRSTFLVSRGWIRNSVFEF